MDDPYAGRDTRTRLLGHKQMFERFEVVTRRTLLVVGLCALAAGAVHSMADPLLGMRATFEPLGFASSQLPSRP